jgi:hypothetical protein
MYYNNFEFLNGPVDAAVVRKLRAVTCTCHPLRGLKLHKTKSSKTLHSYAEHPSIPSSSNLPVELITFLIYIAEFPASAAVSTEIIRILSFSPHIQNNV